MHLLVGLGNIGREYELTRHNFGFMLMDQILDDYGFQVQSKKFKSEVFYGEIDGRKILALKPQTFMNRSGFSVAEFVDAAVPHAVANAASCSQDKSRRIATLRPPTGT